MPLLPESSAFKLRKGKSLGNRAGKKTGSRKVERHAGKNQQEVQEGLTQERK